MKKLLNKIDPHSYNNITFTEIVDLFSKPIVIQNIFCIFAVFSVCMKMLQK